MIVYLYLLIPAVQNLEYSFLHYFFPALQSSVNQEFGLN